MGTIRRLDSTPEWRELGAQTSAAAGGGKEHFCAEMRRFVLMLHHQGEVTVERLTAQLRAFGVAISKRQVCGC